MRIIDNAEEIALDALAAYGLITRRACYDLAELRREGLSTDIAGCLFLDRGGVFWLRCRCCNYCCICLLSPKAAGLIFNPTSSPALRFDNHRFECVLLC